MSEMLEPNMNIMELVEKAKRESGDGTKETPVKKEEVPTPVETVAEPVKEEAPMDEPTKEEEATLKEVEEPKFEKISRDTVKSNSNSALVVNNDEIKGEEEVPEIGSLNPEIVKRVDKYLDDMDKEIEDMKNFKDGIESALKDKGVDVNDKYAVKEARKILLRNNVNINDPEAIRNCKVDLSSIDASYMTEEIYNDNSTEERYEKYNEAVVIIDKIGMGQVINFTEKEKEKLQKAKVIKIKEVEEVSLETIKTKRPKNKMSTRNILQRGRNPFTTNIACVGSGYTAVMRGGSSYEIIALLKEVENGVIDMQNKWQLIYNKIDSMSCGKPDYTTWLHMTAASDFNIFIYGIMVATYPDKDKIAFNCNNKACKQARFTFDFDYDVRSILRVERMSDKMKSRLQRTVDSSFEEQISKDFVENESPLSVCKRVKLPVSEMIVEIKLQSAYDFIHKSIEDLAKDEISEKYGEMATLSTNISRILSPDFEGDLDENGNYEYYILDKPIEIVEALSTLQDKDMVIVNRLVDEIQNDIMFEFGLMNIECPRCHTITEFHPLNVENLLFRKLQQAAAIEVE